MIHTAYAYPSEWDYGLFEIVPPSTCAIWDGCGYEITFGDFFSEPLSFKTIEELIKEEVNQTWDELRDELRDEVDKRFRAVGEVISVIIGNSIR